MKVLVTGATGFVASHLVPALAGGGREVVALGHDRRRIPEGPGVEPLTVDLSLPVDLDGLPPVDAIVHLAQANRAFPDGARTLEAVNVASTTALLEHARRCGAARFVLASSASVYGFGERPWREDDVPAAQDFYASTKLAAERFVGCYRPYLGTTILRLVAPYGPGQRNRMIPRLVAAVRERGSVTLNGDGRPRMNPIHVHDVVRVVRAALASDGHHVLNTAGDETVSVRELAELAGRILGVEPVFASGGGGPPGDLVCDTSRLRATFGLRDLVPLETGIAQLAAGNGA